MDNTRECLPVEGINHVNVDRLANVPEDLREKLMERRLKVVKLKHDHKEEKTNEQWNVFVEENKIYHEEMIDYITVLGDKIAQVKLTERVAENSLQQQNAVMAQRQVDNNRNYERAKSKAVGKSKQVKDDVKKLTEEIKKFDPENFGWEFCYDFEVEKCMKELKDWSVKISQVTKLFREAEDLLYAENIALMSEMLMKYFVLEGSSKLLKFSFLM